MTDPFPRVRRDAILRLHRTLDHARNRRTAEMAEHALTLALGDKRAQDNATFLWRDTLRDARRIIARRKDPLRQPEQLLDENEHDSRTFAPVGFIGAPAHRPDRVAEAKELASRITNAVAAIPNGLACLDGMVLGETVFESAERLGLTQRQVRYARQLVREMAFILSGETP